MCVVLDSWELCFANHRAVYENIGDRYKLEWPTTILGCLGILVIIPVYVFYFNGAYFRDRSKFAMTLESERKARGHLITAEREKTETEHVEHSAA